MTQAIRPRDDGTVDDVAIDCTLFRLEQMTGSLWWAAAYRGGERVTFWLRYSKKKRRIVCHVGDDTIGCEDDRGREHDLAKAILDLGGIEA